MTTGNFSEFSEAVRKAVQTYLPPLAGNIPEIIQFLSAYYQIFDDV